jgi:hypothetical protein
MMVFIAGPTDGFGRAIAKRWERSFIRSLARGIPSHFGARHDELSKNNGSRGRLGSSFGDL